MANQPHATPPTRPSVPRPAPRDDPDFWLSLGIDIATRDGTDVTTLTLEQLSELGRTHLDQRAP